MPGEAAAVIGTIEAATELALWIKGIIDRHNAGVDPTADEAQRIAAAKAVKDGAKAEADAADAELEQQLGEKGLQGVREVGGRQ